jgi:enediyne biosynthesis thioesterase
MVRHYQYQHVVSFAETNLMGNVYYTHPVAWQGRVRELFLQEHYPEILDELAGNLMLVTIRCACELIDEMRAFDQVVIRMFLADLTQSRFTLRFEYWRQRRGEEDVLAARGEQEVVCMRRHQDQSQPTAVPARLREVLLSYRDDYK